MGLQDVEAKKEYRSPIDDVSRDFYIPLLQSAILYRRAVGFFSSSVLVQIAKGILALERNGGKIQIVASPYLSDEDIAAIRKGYSRRDEIVRNAVMREMHEPKTDFEKYQLNILANLITNGTLDIKIAFTENNRRMGMYHEKMGIISDADSNAVAFSGSMNESFTATSLNYETIDVYCSWKGDEQLERVQNKENAFTAIWTNSEPSIKIIDFPDLKEEIIKKYKVAPVEYTSEWEETHSLIAESPKEYGTLKRYGAIIPEEVTLHDYQIQAIDEWERHGFCGIFDMATGTGKTFTGLGAVARLCDKLDDKLAVFIVCPFQHLVEQWVEDIQRFNIKPIIGYSASSQKDWLQRLEDAVRDQKLKVAKREFFCFVCTNATFASDKVQNQIKKIRGDVLLVVDEAHNYGAYNLSRLLTSKFNYRLALSATIERHNDEEGTAKLFDYFGERCIEYTLERAIDEKKLTPYKYYPLITVLNDTEIEKYSDLTFEMSKCLIKGKDGKTTLSERGKRLALERARLVAGAEDKLRALEENIQPFLDDTHILVYCGATKVLQYDKDSTDTDDEDIRQIEAVIDLLGNKYKMRVSPFTSREDVEKREILKREFASGDTMQALIAIKCLDEGVNIPKIKTAFILASTTNPKEYIQRRGRVLRLAEGKDYAVIYDCIALPRPLDEVPSLTDEQRKRELTLIKNELCRAEEFARLAMNMAEAESVLDSIKEAYSINEFALTFEEDCWNG